MKDQRFRRFFFTISLTVGRIFPIFLVLSGGFSCARIPMDFFVLAGSIWGLGLFCPFFPGVFPKAQEREKAP
ncbi:hypothetical protein [Phyllobacterium meliloti]|uniref:hypothetical protein n=1 Tax=Phyllobacterium meliloti TaxID=555317 RepID=UPI001D134A70|nr:hypothetical protein [Phyllobacterium sp. T1293]UGX86823.1 hypothetical protein LLE53_002860 [Phyllobacterium sp. T1293]